MLEIQKLLELKYKYCAISPTPVTDPQLFVEAEVRHTFSPSMWFRVAERSIHRSVTWFLRPYVARARDKGALGAEEAGR
jgi:hypothetical protein